MNLRNRMILEEYRKIRPDFIKLGEVVNEKLHKIVERSGIQVIAIEHRVKTEESLAGKLERMGDFYISLDGLTDGFGARIICFFNDEVDVIGKMVEEEFDVDREKSSDKRKSIDANSFGYLSLHYICRLKKDEGYPEELCDKLFEIQIRTNLQHTWSAIEHDLGYKSEFGVPRVVVREFARLAGLLELADDEFSRIRDDMKSYTEDIRQKIIDNCADDVQIDMISLAEYVKRNKKMRELLSELAAICGAEISEVSPANYIESLLWLKKTTIGDLQEMLEENRPLAMMLAEKALKNSELDILSSSVGLRYLCRAELINKKYSEDQATEFFEISIGSEERARRQAKFLFDSYRKLSLPQEG